MEFNVEMIAVIARYINLILVPAFIWIIKIERRLTRMETIMDIKKKKEERMKYVPSIVSKNATLDDISGDTNNQGKRKINSQRLREQSEGNT